MTYTWERDECHRCRLWECCEGLDEIRQKIDGIWEENCSGFISIDLNPLEQAIMDYLENSEDPPLLDQMIPTITKRTNCKRDEIVNAIEYLNRKHRFSMSIDRNMKIHFYKPWVLKCSRCGRIWDATNYKTHGGGLYFNKDPLCRDCEVMVVEDWFARGRPPLDGDLPSNED